MERKREAEGKEQLNAAIYGLASEILQDFGKRIHTHTDNSRGIETTFHNTRDIRGFSNIRLATTKSGETISIIVIRQYLNERGSNRALRRELDLSREGILKIRAFDGIPVADGVYFYERTLQAKRINLTSLNRWLVEARKELQAKKEQQKNLSPEERRKLLKRKTQEILVIAQEKKEWILWEKERRRRKIR